MLRRLTILYILCFVPASVLAGDAGNVIHSPIWNGLSKEQLSAIFKQAEIQAESYLRSEVERNTIAPPGQDASEPLKIIGTARTGITYPIAEPEGDIYLIAKALKKIDQDIPDREAFEKRIYTVSTKVARTRKQESYKVDLTITVPEDIVGVDANLKPVVVLRKGQTVNPFDTMNFPWTLWFLDEGDDRYFEEAMKDPMSLVIVTNGNLMEIYRKHRGIKLYKATKQMLDRFVIRSVPARARQCKGEKLLCVDLLKGSDA